MPWPIKAVLWFLFVVSVGGGLMQGGVLVGYLFSPNPEMSRRDGDLLALYLVAALVLGLVLFVPA